MRYKLKKGDIIVTILILMSAFIIFLIFDLGIFSERGSILCVTDEKGSNYFNLSENNQITIISRGYTLNICVLDGEAFVKNSDCPDKTCRNSSPISRKGETIVCVPAGVVLRITEGNEKNYDFAAG